MDPKVIKQVEAILFASGRFIDAKRIAELAELNPKHVTRALKTLQENYADEGSSLQLVEEDGAWKIHVKDEYLDLVSKVVSDTEVSGPVLETLSVIAWRSPVLQSEIVDVRGSNTYEHVKELVDRDFVVKEPEGRSYRLRITEKFFEYFDIEGRDDIRKLFKEVEEAHRQKEMEVELEKKRLEKAMAQVEAGESVVVDLPVAQQKLSETAKSKDINLDDLDNILEKSRKKREEVAGDLSKMKKKDEESDEDADDEDSAPDEGADSDDVEVSEDEDSQKPVKDDYPDDDSDENPPLSSADIDEGEGIDDMDLEKAKKIREQVEKDIEKF